jgi:hypothetical protein
MNPIQILKSIYETFGAPHPRISMAVVVLLGGAAAGALWLFAAKQVAKDQGARPTPTISGPASTTGPQSPAITGDQNQVQYSQPSEPTKKTPSPRKESKP